jgi:hypothetical protein
VARDSLYIFAALRIFTEHSAQRGDVLGQIIVFDKTVRPDQPHQFLFREQPALVLDKHHERVERL